jgi:selenocysteine lyase/cysteine desulfurase
MAGAVVIPNFYDQLDRWQILLEHDNVHSVAQNEEYWAVVRSGYRLKPDYINLENGYYCIVPQETLEKYIDHARHVNYQGSYYMRTVQLDNKHRAAARLAKLIGAQENEVILTRNTTESLDTIIGGYPWQEGDEAIYAQQDYGAMRIMFELQERRHGIKSKIVSVPNHPSSDKEIVALYESAITDRTKLLMVCHIINITGHIMPIRKICDMAHARGVDVMVDGAHAIGHFDFDIKDLNCDYYGSSLHKWLSVPLGSGLLYVKEGMATKIWPTFAEWNKEDHDILKLNHTGTHPPHTDLAVNDAIDYLSRIGPKRKEERLRYIQRYWTDQVRDIDGINVNTPRELHRSCGIANVGIEGIAPSILAKRLMSEFNIWTVAINQPPVIGCRITPNIYTSLEELDTFVAALKTMAAE